MSGKTAGQSNELSEILGDLQELVDDNWVGRNKNLVQSANVQNIIDRYKKDDPQTSRTVIWMDRAKLEKMINPEIVPGLRAMYQNMQDAAQTALEQWERADFLNGVVLEYASHTSDCQRGHAGEYCSCGYDQAIHNLKDGDLDG
jgi:siroheme synthase